MHLFLSYTNLHYCKEWLKMFCTCWWGSGVCSYGTGLWLPSPWEIDKLFFILGSETPFCFHTQLFTNFGFLKTLQTSEGGPGHALVTSSQWPALWQEIVVHLGPGGPLDICHIVLSFSRLRRCKIIRWLCCVVRMSKHQAFMWKLDQCMCIYLTKA